LTVAWITVKVTIGVATVDVHLDESRYGPEQRRGLLYGLAGLLKIAGDAVPPADQRILAAPSPDNYCNGEGI
jgi:hypothetical protein